MDKIAFYSGSTAIYWNSVVLTLAAATANCFFLAFYLGKSGNGAAGFAAVPVSMVLSLVFARFFHWYCQSDSYQSFSAAMTDSPHAVAEHAMALLLTINRRTHKAYIRTRDFNFSLQGLAGFDLYGKTVGVIGTGKIGRVFADICKGFGMNILAYDKFPAADSGLNYVELPELFAKSDIISLHCPLTDETRHIINADSIAQMKKGVTIINTSRGALVNTEDLINGIKEKQVGAACLDVYEEEGDLFYEDYSGHIVQDDKLVRLIAMPTVIVTSHQAFLTNEALDNIAATTVNNLTRFFSGDPDTTTEVCCHK